MAPDVDADLLSRLPQRGAQEGPVLDVMSPAREADLTGPRIAFALPSFPDEDLEAFGPFPQDDHHRGRGVRPHLRLGQFRVRGELTQPVDRRLAQGDMATLPRHEA